MPNGYTSKCSAPYWSNQPFLIFDIWALWQSARMSKIKNSRLDQYGAEHSGRLIFATIRENVNERVNGAVALADVASRHDISQWSYWAPVFNKVLFVNYSLLELVVTEYMHKACFDTVK